MSLVVLPHVFRDVPPGDRTQAFLGTAAGPGLCVQRLQASSGAQARISFAEEAEDCEQRWHEFPGWVLLGPEPRGGGMVGSWQGSRSGAQEDLAHGGRRWSNHTVVELLEEGLDVLPVEGQRTLIE